MAQQLFKNNSASNMSGTLSQGGTTLVLATGTGDEFPTPTGGDYFLATLFEKDETGVEEHIEVVKVTDRTGDTLTIERDFEEMTGQVGGLAYPSAPSRTVYVELRWTSAGASNFAQRVANLSDLADAAEARDNIGISAENTPFTPYGTLEATDVQAAIQELVDEKQELDGTLSALGGLSTSNNTMPYFTGTDTAAVTTLTGYARTLLDDEDSTAARATLGLNNVDNTSDATKWAATATLTNKTIDLTDNILIATSAEFASGISDETGTGVLVFNTSPTLVTPNLGTPASGTLTYCTGLPVSTGISGMASGAAAFLATPSSTNLRSLLTDETGTGSLVFANSPDLAGIPTAPTAAVNTNTTQIATTAYVVAQIADDAPTKSGSGATGTWSINIDGSAATLATGRTISMTGDVTWTTSTGFDGSANVTGAGTLANSGVTAGTYTKVTVDSKGRVTVGAAVASSDVTTALGYTPANKAGDTFSGYVDFNTTDAVKVPVGTTAQRPAGATGKFRFNSSLGKFEGYNGSAWGAVGGGATGGGADEIFIENGQTVSVDYSITSGKNAGTFGPVTVSSGVTVTVPSGSVWTIV